MDRQPSKAPSIPEIALAVYVATVYVFASDPSRAGISTWAGVGLIAVTLLDALRSGSFVVNASVLARVAFSLYCVITAIGAYDVGQPLLGQLQLALLMTAVVTISSSANSVRAVECGSYVGALVLLGIAWFQTGHQVFLTARYGSVIGANGYALALLAAVLFAIKRVLMPGQRSSVWTRAGLMILILAAAEQIVVATGSRKGVICLGVAGAFSIGGVWLLRGRRQALRVLVPTVAIICIVLILGSHAVNLSRFKTFEEVFAGAFITDASARTRLSMAGEAWTLWQAKPTFGWGFDQFRYLTPWATYSHSNYLELLANGGIVGMGLFYLSFVFIGIDIARKWRRAGRARDHAALAWAALVLGILFLWGVAGVQYDQKLDAILLAAVSTVPYAIVRTPMIRAAGLVQTYPPGAPDRHREAGAAWRVRA